MVPVDDISLVLELLVRLFGGGAAGGLEEDRKGVSIYSFCRLSMPGRGAVKDISDGLGGRALLVEYDPFCSMSENPKTLS